MCHSQSVSQSVGEAVRQSVVCWPVCQTGNPGSRLGQADKRAAVRDAIGDEAKAIRREIHVFKSTTFHLTTRRDVVYGEEKEVCPSAINANV